MLSDNYYLYCCEFDTLEMVDNEFDTLEMAEYFTYKCQ